MLSTRAAERDTQLTFAQQAAKMLAVVCIPDAPTVPDRVGFTKRPGAIPVIGVRSGGSQTHLKPKKEETRDAPLFVPGFLHRGRLGGSAQEASQPHRGRTPGD